MTFLEIFILLLAAHSYGDFLLQTNWMVLNKHKFTGLCAHTGVHGIVAYLILQQWHVWLPFVVLFVIHTIIDRAKISFKSSARAFAYDQLAHVISLVGIAWMTVYLELIPQNAPEVFGRDWIIAGAGFCAAVIGAGYFIGEVATSLISTNPELETALSKGLKGGGAQIGRLERALIFIFIAIGQPTAIGFLIAAKSILRFEEAKQQNLAEYVLIGTFWSFALAISISWLTLKLIAG